MFSQYKRLWVALAVVIIGSFAVLGGFGYQAIKNAPPIPLEVATADGRVIFDGHTIQSGQSVWQSIGGQEIGSIFGHGAYVGPRLPETSLRRPTRCGHGAGAAAIPHEEWCNYFRRPRGAVAARAGAMAAGPG